MLSVIRLAHTIVLITVFRVLIVAVHAEGDVIIVVGQIVLKYVIILVLAVLILVVAEAVVGEDVTICASLVRVKDMIK